MSVFKLYFDLGISHIADIQGYKILRSDLVRLEVLSQKDIFDVKEAANMNKRTMVYDEMFRRAADLAKKEAGIILDATFIKKSLRKRAAEIAAKHNLTFVIQQTQCPKEVSIRRIMARSRESYESNALTEVAYTNNVKAFEDIDLNDLKKGFPDLRILHLLVDTTDDDKTGKNWFVIGKSTA